MTAWHEVPKPSPGSRTARRAAWALALFGVMASAAYWWLWLTSEVATSCFEGGEIPVPKPCPPVPPPEDWLIAARLVAWSAGAVATLLALVVAERAVHGRARTRTVWLAIGAAIAAGAAFSGLVLVPGA